MNDVPRTQFAMAAVDMATLFNTAFGSVQPAVKLTAPEGQSTGGGVQAMQHIALADPIGGGTVVVGSVHTFERKAELRSFDYANHLYSQRHQGQSFPMDRVAYEALGKRFAEFFSSQGFQLAILALPKSPAPAPAPQKTGGSSAAVWVTLLLVALAAGGAAVWWFFFRSV